MAHTTHTQLQLIVHNRWCNLRIPLASIGWWHSGTVHWYVLRKRTSVVRTNRSALYSSGKRARCQAKSTWTGRIWEKRKPCWWRVVEPSTLLHFCFRFSCAWDLHDSEINLARNLSSRWPNHLPGRWYHGIVPVVILQWEWLAGPWHQDMQTNGFLTDCPQCERATSTVTWTAINIGGGGCFSHVAWNMSRHVFF